MIITNVARVQNLFMFCHLYKIYKFSPDFQLMAGLRHPHALQFLALGQEEPTLPVLERMDKSLDAHLPSILFYLYVAAVLLYLHFRRKIFHRDIWSVFVCVCDLQCL